MNNIIFIGGWFFDKISNELLQKNKYNTQFAADIFQKSIISGLKFHYPDIYLYSFPFIGSYPKRSNIIFTPSCNISENEKSFSFCNITGFKQIVIYFKIFNALEKHIKNNSSDCTIIVYSIQYPYLKALCDIKKKYPNIKIVLIIPDLLEYMGGPTGKLYTIFKKHVSNSLYKLLTYVDSYVILSEKMNEKVNLTNKPYTVLEGIYNKDSNFSDTSISNIKNKKMKNKIVMYSGNLNERYGIMKLLNAFSLIKESDYELWIRGDGNCKKNVIEYSKKDSRVKYLKEMKLSDLRDKFKEATVLVNPVSPDEEFTNYFFPSKTLEYMASGTPMLMFRLSCIPKEYYPFIYFFDNSDEKSMSDRIKEICEKHPDELSLFGHDSSQYIFNHKNAIIQTTKIAELITHL